MTDSELLELAAKAAGYTLSPDGLMKWDDTSAEFRSWDPLTGDGDALRLAVKCRIDLYIGSGNRPEAWAGYYAGKFPVGINKQRFVGESHGDDPYAANRRAIVRAAAEIGREMK